MPGGKGPATGGDGEGFVSGNLGLIALFAVLVLAFGGIVAANQAGLFSEESGAQGSVLSCEETFTGRTVHEHARLRLYLDSDETYDFSAARYQVASPKIHFEERQSDGPPGGARVHVHEARPTIGCLLQTLGWSVSEDSLTTDTGETYAADANHEFQFLVDGEPSDRGFNTPLEQRTTYTVRYQATDDAGGQADGNDTNASARG